jgi:hypothetical protein
VGTVGIYAECLRTSFVNPLLLLSSVTRQGATAEQFRTNCPLCTPRFVAQETHYPCCPFGTHQNVNNALAIPATLNVTGDDGG